MSLRDNENVTAFVLAAKEYCSVLEADCDDAELWVERVLQTLSILYACATNMPEVDTEDAPDVDDDSVQQSIDDWNEMRAALGGILGDQRYYREIFDPSEPVNSKEDPVVADIADDLADIYRDIKTRIKALGPSR